MKLRIGDSARWQIRTAIERLLARDRVEAIAFRDELARLLADPRGLIDVSSAIPEFPQIPIREVITHGHRLFLWERDDEIWVGGIWPQHAF